MVVSKGRWMCPFFWLLPSLIVKNQIGASQPKVQRYGFRWDCWNHLQARAVGFQTIFSRVMVKWSLEDEWSKMEKSPFSAAIYIHFFLVEWERADNKSKSQPSFERCRTSLMGKLPVFEMSPYWLEKKVGFILQEEAWGSRISMFWNKDQLLKCGYWHWYYHKVRAKIAFSPVFWFVLFCLFD